jgi:aminoglycoside phosphotransferase (APT) family kinase protein
MTHKTDWYSLQPRNPGFSLEACLKEIGVSIDTVTPLAEGLVNYVWRATDKTGKSWILKHAEPSLKLNASIESDPARLSYEVRGMNSEAVLFACKAVNGVTVPKVISYNDSSHTLVTTDGGTRTLADAYAASELDMGDVGKRLAKWLAALHKATQDTSPGVWENESAENVSMVAANGMPQRMAEHGYGRRIGEIARDEFFALQPGERACCVQGDFRPGNILVGEDNLLSIIDWEDSRRQSPALDLRLFAAQAYLLDVLHGERGLLEAFLTTYRLHAGDICDEQIARRTAVMFGGFLVFWLPQMDLCNASQSADLAAYGAKVVDKAIARDQEWLQRSRLAPLFI